MSVFKAGFIASFLVLAIMSFVNAQTVPQPLPGCPTCKPGPAPGGPGTPIGPAPGGPVEK